MSAQKCGSNHSKSLNVNILNLPCTLLSRKTRKTRSGFADNSNQAYAFTVEINPLGTKMKTKQEEIDIFIKPVYMHQQLLSLVFLCKLKLNLSLTYGGNKPSTVQEI